MLFDQFKTLLLDGRESQFDFQNKILNNLLHLLIIIVIGDA